LQPPIGWVWFTRRLRHLQISTTFATQPIDGEKRTVVEYKFDEAELNKASINIDKALMLPAPSEPKEKENSKIHSEIMLFLEQANRGPGKEKGRTGDKGRVPDISDTVVSVYFRQCIQGLKEKMLQGGENPFSMVFCG